MTDNSYYRIENTKFKYKNKHKCIFTYTYIPLLNPQLSK